MSRVNGLQKTWSLKNYLTQYVQRGLKDYIDLNYYHSIGFPIIQAARMLVGLSSATGNFACSSTGKAVRDGTFKIKTRTNIDIIANFINRHGDQNPAFKTANFISSFELCLRVEDFDPSQLTRKLANIPTMITRTASIDQMLDQFEEVYNYHQSIKVPIAFKAKQKKRLA